MNAPCNCRWATGTDFKALVGLYTEIHVAAPETLPGHELRLGLLGEAKAKWVDALKTEAVRIFSAGFGSPETAFVGLIYPEGQTEACGLIRVSLQGGGTALLHDILVLPAFWDRGIGSAALQWVEEELRRRGITEVQCAVAFGNLRGRAFLQAAEGFVPTEVLWSRWLPPLPPVRFECGGTGGVSDFGAEPAKVVTLKPARKPRAKKRKEGE